MTGALRIAEHESENAMSVQNLAIVFGPTLFKQAQPGPNGQINGMADAGLQNKVRHAFTCHDGHTLTLRFRTGHRNDP